MFKNFSLKDRFKLLILPVVVLTAILVLFISYSEYQKSLELDILEKDIKVIEDLRKLVSLIAKERELSLKFLTSKNRVLAKRVVRDLKKQRSINNTRIRSLKNKLNHFSDDEVSERYFLKQVSKNIKSFDAMYSVIRRKVDEKEFSPKELIDSYSEVISTFIHSIAISSIDVQNSSISKSIVIYSIFLKYLDVSSQRDIFLSKAISQKNMDNVNIELEFELSKIDAKRESIIEIATSLVSEKLLSHYKRLSQTPEILAMKTLNDAILSNDFSKVGVMTDRDFIYLTRSYYKRLKELEDYISRRISEELNLRIDENRKRVAFLIITFLLSILAILYTTHVVYNNLREMLFFGTIKIRGQILRVITNMNLSSDGKNRNEITSLIHLVNQFTQIIKVTLSNMRTNFRDILSLSNHLSESSETIVNHIQKQSRYLEEIDLQMAIFLENIRNSELSFDNLKVIIEDSSAKINNLTLDVVYISYEVLSIKDLNNKVIQNKVDLKNVVNENITMLEKADEPLNPENRRKLLEALKKMIDIVAQENLIIAEQDKKLTNLSRTALTIKQDAEINNANLSDILGVITILGFETNTISADIKRTVDDNGKFIEVSKNMLQKSEFVSSDVTVLNQYIVNLDKEFNKFRF